MCGIAGFLDSRRRLGAETVGEIARRMGRSLSHRGPDSSGVWVDEPSGIAFAHRRLSILDLSEAGHQPMASADGRYVIVFNGEIYNHLELRRELDTAGLASPWRGHSDT